MASKSGLSYTIKITYTDGGEQSLKTAPIDIVRWEKANGRSFAVEEPTVSQLLWAAWAAGRRKKEIGDEHREFDKWCETVEDFERVDDEEGDGDPTQPDPLGS